MTARTVNLCAMFDSSAWLPAVAWQDSYVNAAETSEQQEVGRSVQKKRANKAKTIEQLADDTITITEPLSNFPVDCLKGGDTGPLQARCNKSEEPSNMPQEEGTTNVQEKRKSVKSVDALASKKRRVEKPGEDQLKNEGIRSVESDADAAKVDVHVVNSNKAHTEKQRKKKRKAKTSTVHQGADNEDSSVQVKGDETQHGSEAVPQAKEQLKAKKKSQPQAPAPANSDKYQSNVQQRALQTEQRPSISKADQKKGKLSTLDKMKAQLQGGRFRMLNEKLYTTEGDEAFEYMQGSPELFRLYHQGFRVQAKSWSKNPVELALKWLRTKPDGWTVADFGCGDAQIAQELSKSHTVHSFDLCASNEHVTACNMACVPCKSGSCNAAIFSLALMGTDYGKFLLEAHRVLKTGGFLWIAEVRSRFVPENRDTENFAPFLASLQRAGFKALKQDLGSKMFVVWVVKKVKDDIDSITVQWPVLKPCIYKRR